MCSDPSPWFAKNFVVLEFPEVRGQCDVLFGPHSSRVEDEHAVVGERSLYVVEFGARQPNIPANAGDTRSERAVQLDDLHPRTVAQDRHVPRLRADDEEGPSGEGPDLRFLGADDGIRTRDPNLGKVGTLQSLGITIAHDRAARTPRARRHRAGTVVSEAFGWQVGWQGSSAHVGTIRRAGLATLREHAVDGVVIAPDCLDFCKRAPMGQRGRQQDGCACRVRICS